MYSKQVIMKMSKNLVQKVQCSEPVNCGGPMQCVAVYTRTSYFRSENKKKNNWLVNTYCSIFVNISAISIYSDNKVVKNKIIYELD